jgi:hypothetical protein
MLEMGDDQSLGLTKERISQSILVEFLTRLLTTVDVVCDVVDLIATRPIFVEIAKASICTMRSPESHVRVFSKLVTAVTTSGRKPEIGHENKT